MELYVGKFELGSIEISLYLLDELQKEKTNDQYVFPSPNGSPISPDSVNNMLKRVLARAGIPKVRFHDLRHTFATIALQNGVDINTVSGILATSPQASPWIPIPM